MPPRKSKRVAEKTAQQTNQQDPQAQSQATTVLAPEQIATTLAQLLEGQRQTQQQIDALLAQQNNPQPARTQRVNSGPPRAPARTRGRPRTRTETAEDAREIINNRRAAREERSERMARASARDRSVVERTDLRDTINRSQSRTLPPRTTRQEEEASSTDPTYLPKVDREGVDARIKDLEEQIRKLGKKPARDHVNTETESLFIDRVTKFAIPKKFKHPNLDSYNGSGSPVDHVRTYKA